jgi:5-methylcytosine-specific restriction endonuclease McrA
MNRKVLVLNQDYSPLTLCSIQRAFVLVFMSKVDLIDRYDDLQLNTVTDSFEVPAVIRLQKYISYPYKGVNLTRQNIFKRDGYSCQYCGTKSDLTIDHVVPKAKGGKTIWKNIVAACRRCNTIKGDNKPSERGLALQRKPFKPSYISFIRDFSGMVREEWKPYLINSSSSRIAM